MVVFLLILFGINRGLIYLYGKMTASSILSRRDARFHETDKTGVEILVLGDSHAYAGITTDTFDGKLIKWVSPAESYHLNYYKLKYSLTRFKPNVLILPLDLHSFSYTRYRINQDYYWVKYVDYFEIGAAAGKRSLYTGKYIHGKFFPYIGAGNIINDWAMKNIFKVKKKGMRLRQELNGKSRLTKAFARIRARAQLKSKNYFYKPLVVYFKKILDLCRENGITVLLVKYPVSREYYQYASTFISIRYFNYHVKNVLKDYDNYFILDFRKIFFDREEFLRDVDHVNEKGNERISRRIAKFLEKTGALKIHD